MKTWKAMPFIVAGSLTEITTPFPIAKSEEHSNCSLKVVRLKVPLKLKVNASLKHKYMSDKDIYTNKYDIYPDHHACV